MLPRICSIHSHELLEDSDPTNRGIRILGVHETGPLPRSQAAHEAQQKKDVEAENCITCHTLTRLNKGLLPQLTLSLSGVSMCSYPWDCISEP